MNVSGLEAIQILKEALAFFGDLRIDIKVQTDPAAETCATLFFPPLKSQSSMPWTPNIYAPHGAIFSRN